MSSNNTWRLELISGLFVFGVSVGMILVTMTANGGYKTVLGSVSSDSEDLYLLRRRKKWATTVIIATGVSILIIWAVCIQLASRRS